MNPNDPAFPCKEVGTLMNPPDSAGLTKREYFAAMAMQGLILHIEKREDFTAKLPPGVIARMAFAQADAMIAEGSK